MHSNRTRKILLFLVIALSLLLLLMLVLLFMMGTPEKNVPNTEPPTQTSGTTDVTQATESHTEPMTTATEPVLLETTPTETEAPPVATSPPVVIPTPDPPPPPPIQPPVEEEEIASGDITCEDFALFSGQYVEDGRDELVTNVASILVKNQTDSFLEFAILAFDIDDRVATFIVTGLPAGRSAWVMEATRMTATHDSVFTYVDSLSSFRDSVITQTDKVSITTDGNMMTVTNNSQEALEEVCVFYRTVHTDGNFFGGITYIVDFGTLEPGQSLEKLAGHYDESKSEIIRISWLAD